MTEQNSLFEPLNNRRINDILQVIVHVGLDEYVLSETAIFVLDDGLVQVLVDVHEKRICRILGQEDVIIQGDYDDRTSVELRPWGAVQVPFHISTIYGVWEKVAGNDKEYLVGAFFANEQKELIVGVNMHLDDFDCGTADALFQYIGRLVPNAHAITIRPMG